MPISEIPNLLNGVSQQAEENRFPSQAEEQSNFWSDIVEGLVKRPPLEHVTKLNTSGPGTTDFVHFINRDANEQFIVIVTGGLSPSMEVYDLAGNQQTVLDAGGNPVDSSDLAYLATSTPRQSLRAITVADYTFFLNRETVTAMDGTTTTDRNPEALLFLRQSRVNTTYKIDLYENADATGTAYNVSHTTGQVPESQGDILDTLVGKLTTAGSGTHFAIVKIGPSARIVKNDGSDFRVVVSADQPDSFFSFKETVQHFSSLPALGYVGMKFKVVGSPSETADDYYVEYVPSEPTATQFVEGSWVETVAENIEDTFDATTLPHTLTNNGDGTFTFQTIAWKNRLAGDTETNPDPSFIGNTINDIFFFRNRLGLLSDENLILSEAGGFFNFWRTSVVSLLDSDRIDVSASSSKVAILQNAVPNNKELILFSEQAQFIVPDDGELLTPKTIRLVQASAAPNLKNAKPIAVGDFVFFGFDRGSSSGVNQFSVDPDTGEFRPFDVSDHIPRYISGDIFQFVGSAAQSMLVALSDGFTQGAYVYRWYDKAGQRLQSAWFKVDFDTNNEVRAVGLIDSTLYVVIAREGDGTYLEKMDLEIGKTDSGASWKTFLDRRLDESQFSSISYDSSLDQTEITLPFFPQSSATMQVITKTGLILPQNASPNRNIIYVQGDVSSASLWVGQKYVASYTPTRPIFRRGTRDGNSSPVTGGRFQVREGQLAFNDSILFSVEVTPQYRDTYIYKFVSKIIGENPNTVGAAMTRKDGVFRFPVMADARTVSVVIKNDSPFPSKLLSLDWHGTFNEVQR